MIIVPSSEQLEELLSSVADQGYPEELGNVLRKFAGATLERQELAKFVAMGVVALGRIPYEQSLAQSVLTYVLLPMIPAPEQLEAQLEFWEAIIRENEMVELNAAFQQLK